MIEKMISNRTKPSTNFLDGLRGIAAVYVLFHHSRWLLTESSENRWKLNKMEPWLIRNLTDTLIRYGHEAVIFFFVLSGFVIHFSVLKSNQLNNYKVDWKAYFIKRLNRIYPPLIFALILTIFIDLLGAYVFKFDVYNSGSKYSIFPLKNFRDSLIDLLGNILNIQVLVKQVSTFGSDYTLWSLSYEWWFYLLYPFFYYLNRKSKSLVLLIQILLFILTQCLYKDNFIPILTPIFQKMVIWWMGVLLAEVYFGNVKISFKLLSFLLISFPIAIHFFGMTIYSDFFWGLGFVGIISFLMLLPDNNLIKVVLQKLSIFGVVSYTLYVCHEPILYFTHSYLIEQNKGSLPQGYIWMLTIPTLILCLVIPFGQKLEKIKIIKLPKTK